MADEFYRNAKAYDILFSDRYFDEEVEFLQWCLNNHSKLNRKQLEGRSFLEMACGPAHHAREFAKQGWNAYALDISEEMIGYARLQAESENIKINTIISDMTDFALDKPVILAATLMESIAHLTTNEQMISHFRSVAKNMLPGGIYVIEGTHPQFFFPDKEPNSWKDSFNGTEVEITFGKPDDDYDSIAQIWQTTSELKITEPGGKVFKSKSKIPLRWYLIQELKLLIELSGVFDWYTFYGSLYGLPPHPLDDSDESDALVAVLRVK